MHKIAHHILTKKAVLCVAFVLVVFTLLPIQVAAQTHIGLEVEAEYLTNINLTSDLKADVVYTITLANKSADVISQFQLELPFREITNLSVMLGDTPATYSTSQLTAATSLTMDFGLSGIRPASAAELMVSFRTTAGVTDQSGFYHLYIPPISADYVVSHSTLQLSYPPSFPKLTYVSSANTSDVDHKLSLSSLAGYLVLWGEESLIDIKGSFELQTKNNLSDLSLVNLPSTFADQDVVFASLESGNSTMLADQLDNSWLLFEGDQTHKAEYSVRVHRIKQTSRIVESLDLEPIAFPEVLASAIGGLPPEEQVRLIYEYVLDVLEPDTSPQLAALDLVRLNEPDLTGDFHRLEYVYLLAGLLSNLDIAFEINYGYVFAPENVAKLDLTTPQVWLKVDLTGEIVLLDPFMEDATGLVGYGVAGINRVAYGSWVPERNYDGVLGLLSNSYLPRPATVSLGQIEQELVYDMSLAFPTTAVAGNYYQGRINFINLSGHPIILDSLLLNGEELASKSLRVNSDLFIVIKPLGDTEINLTGLLERDLLTNSVRNGKIVVKPLDTVFPTRTASYTIKFRPNTELIVGGLALGIGTFVVVFSFLSRRRLRQYLMRKSIEKRLELS